MFEMEIRTSMLDNSLYCMVKLSTALASIKCLNFYFYFEFINLILH